MALLVLAGLSVFLSLGDAAAPHPIIDFDAFRIAGGLAHQGRLAEAYDWPTMERLEAALGRHPTGFLPYAYPPAFGLIMSALDGLPDGAAYALFVCVGSVALVAALGSLSRHWFWPAFLALSPTLLINVMGGQNGMATAGLAGLAAACGLRRHSPAAGVLTALLAALKPQTALGPPLFFAARRHWQTLAVAVTALTALGVVTLTILGVSIVPAFLHGLSETSRGLALGRFPLHRMVSVYAGLRSIGTPYALALTIHAAVAGAMLLAVAQTASRSLEPAAAAGLALMCSALVSPYFYDYDLPVVGLGLAAALPALERRVSHLWAATALAALALVGGVGVSRSMTDTGHVSIAAPILVALIAACLIALRRPPRSPP